MFSSIASFYPALDERSSLSPWYAPICFCLTLLPFFCSSQNLIDVRALSFTVLLILCLSAPFFTNGNPSADYYNTGPFFAMPLWFLDFASAKPEAGKDVPRYIGNRSQAKSDDAKDESKNGVGWEDLKSTAARLRWVFRLMIPSHRGIGWNWQVKGVPPNPAAQPKAWSFVETHLLWMMLTYLRSGAMLVLLGFASKLQCEGDHNSFGRLIVLNAVIGWSGALWVWDRLSCFYSLAAALSVALGICGTWEWPPLMGQLKDAWSVRQMWSSVYHQTIRRMVQQPGIRFVRSLGLRKGNISSKYSQLYISFSISCLFHQFQMFNVTRRDMGEFAFFMSQPIAITAEDFVQWAWGKWRGPKKTSGRFERVVGYVWTFLWFSYSLRIYIEGLRDADIIRDALIDTRPFDLGGEYGVLLLESLQ